MKEIQFKTVSSVNKQMKKMKRNPATLRWLWLISLAGIALIIAMVTHFFINEPPIIQGDLQRNVPYKKDHYLDIYFPTKKTHARSPILLYMHGGAWVTGKKEAINFNRIHGAVNKLRDMGFTVISPDYTLARNGNSPFPDCVQDGFDAIQWVVHHADSLNLDTTSFGLIGESAGAHISMLLAFAPPSRFDREHKKTDIDYVVDIYGPTDLHRLYHRPEIDSLSAFLATLPSPINKRLDLPKLLFGFDPKADSIKTAHFMSLYSPVRFLTDDNVPPVLMIHGDKDHIVPVKQSIVLKTHLDSFSIPNQLKILEGVCHGFIGIDNEEKAALQHWIVDFIENHYKDE